MPQNKSGQAYGEDLAYIHDTGFGFHANGLAPALLRTLSQARPKSPVVVDLGCGSGIWLKELMRAGYRGVGVDISPAMVELARRRVPEATFHVGSLLDFDLPCCGGITALGEVLAYQFDRRNNRLAIQRLFRRAHEALVRGGVFVFDLPEIGLDRDRPPTWRAGDDWACLMKYEYDARREQLVRHITTFRQRRDQAGELYRRDEETHRVQLYEPRAIAAALRQAGFRVRLWRRLGDYTLLPGRFGVTARRA